MPARLLALALVACLVAIPAAAQPGVDTPGSPVQVAPLPRPAPFDLLADWTPRPAAGKAEPWEKATDKDWIDARFRAMDTGPFLNCTMRYPLGKDQPFVYKATVVKLGEKGDAGAVFDRATMRLAAAWTGGYLTHSDRRFGLLNTPTPKGELIFANPPGPGWADPDGKWDAKEKRFTTPLDPKWVKYRGMYVHGDRVVFKYTVGEAEILDSPQIELAAVPTLSRTLEIGPHKALLAFSVAEAPTQFAVGSAGRHAVISRAWIDTNRCLDIAFVADKDGFVGESASGEPGRFGRRVGMKPSTESRQIEILTALVPGTMANQGPIEALARKRPLPEALTPLTKGGPKRWGEPIVTKLVRGDRPATSETANAGEDGSGVNRPFAVDTLTVPYSNRFNALFFCTGLDHLPDGRVAVSTCHGDVWLVKVDETAATCSWQRFATGLYHPLGLKVIDGKVVVLERGQLTRLHDLNADGEADFYECVNNSWDTGPGEHSYDTCLETDPQGNFYFFKTGDTDLPTGGCLMRVTKDGGKAEVFATGFRHPIGMGMSPTGVLTGADQEGNWMPATRVDEYRKGGFYGDMRGHHRADPPKTYDPPICWLPREVDNSAGGQVWVPANTFGPLAGLPLHLSYGRCKPYVLLRQECGGGLVQGGVAALDVKFLSGVCRGRFGPDGHLYVCGLNGWQTAAQADGCLQRVRYAGKPLDVPVKLVVDGNAIRLTFSRALDATAAADPTNYKAAWWNYRWGGDYGSKRWKASDPKAEGQDEFGPRAAKLLADGRTVELVFDKLQPVMQMQLGYNLRAADGKPVAGSVVHTIHTTGK